MAGLPLHGTLGKFTWRMLATVLAGESICVFFGALVARAVAATGPDSTRAGAYLAVGTALAVLCIVAAGLLRRPFGVTLGWAIQVLTLVSALVVPMMLVIGVVFLALWVTCLVQGGRIDRVQAAQALQAARAAEDAGDAGGRAAPADGDQGAGRVTG